MGAGAEAARVSPGGGGGAAAAGAGSGAVAAGAGDVAAAAAADGGGIRDPAGAATGSGLPHAAQYLAPLVSGVAAGRTIHVAHLLGCVNPAVPADSAHRAVVLP